MQETINNLNQTTGKLKLVHKISEWLKTQPDLIDKEDLIQYLLINVGESESV